MEYPSRGVLLWLKKGLDKWSEKKWVCETKVCEKCLIFCRLYDMILNCQSNFGWVPEWPKGADCKSVATRFGGSNPPPSIGFQPVMRVMNAGVAEQADAQDLKSCEG